VCVCTYLERVIFLLEGFAKLDVVLGEELCVCVCVCVRM
jgi:hypothetical protein